MGKYISIFIYLTGFFLSAKLFEVRKRVATKGKFICVLFSIMILVLLAGLRGETVGTDVLVYVKPLYSGALKIGSFTSYMAAFPQIDIGYLCVVYYITKLFKTLSAVLIVTAIITYVPIFVVAEYFEKEKGIKGSIILLCYDLLFFNLTLNAVRQSVAISFVLLCFIYIDSQHWEKAVISAVIAQMFHNSAILGIAILIFSFFTYRVENKKKRFGYMCVFIILFAVIGPNIGNIIGYFVQKGVLSEKMNVYLDVFLGGDNSKSYMFEMSKGMIFVAALKLGTLVIPAFLGTTYTKSKTFEMVKMNTMIGVFSYCVLYFAFKSIYVYRITLYGEIFATLWMAYSGSNIATKRLEASTRNTIIIIYAIAYWYINYVLLGLHQTLPYVI